MALSGSTKAQAWYLDFSIALLIFILTLVIFFTQTNNFRTNQKGSLSQAVADARSISSSLMQEGFPSNWSKDDVIRIGIANDYRLNMTKLRQFSEMDYQRSRLKLGTAFDYYLFFTDEEGNPISINGLCGVGSSSSNARHVQKSAYYFQDSTHSTMKDYMNITLNSDIYYPGQLANLVGSISNYSMIVLEHPLISDLEITLYKPAIEQFASEGGTVVLGGQVASTSGSSFLGVNYYRQALQNPEDRNATINQSFKSFSQAENVVFSSANYVINVSGSSSFSDIAVFNIAKEDAAASWKFANGSNYFFSDFNETSYSGGNFTRPMQDTIGSALGGYCTYINISSKQDLAKNERYLSFNSKIIKMVVFVWR